MSNMLENQVKDVVGFGLLPSVMMDIVRGRYFYDQFEFGLGLRFRDYIVDGIDKLQENAGVLPLNPSPVVVTDL